MKNKKHKIYFTVTSICIISLIIFTFSKFMTSSEKKDTFIIGMSQANLYEPWRIYMNKEIEEAAKKYKNVKVIFKDAGGDTEKQKKRYK